MSIRYRADIDGLRAVAVLAVVLYHAFPHGFKGGFIGVDIFFVISGYLITSIIVETRDREGFFSEFYSRRVRRIFPALILVLLFCVVYGWLFLMPDEYELLGRHVLSTGFFSTNIILWLESGYFDVASEFKPLLHMWSLGVEEQFYIVWPLLLFVSVGRRGWFVGCFTFLSFILCVVLTDSFNSQAFYLPHTRLWELAVGGLVALSTSSAICFSAKNEFAAGLAEKLSRLLKLKVFLDFISIIGLGLILASLVLIRSGKGFPGWPALGPVLGASLLICAGPGAFLNRTILSSRFLVFIGLISYPLYLWHWPLLSFARIAYDQAPPHVVRVLLVVVSFVLAFLTYRLVETPFRVRMSRRCSLIILSFSMLFVMLAGLGVAVSQGAPSRFSDAARLESVPEFKLFVEKYLSDSNYLESLKQGRRDLIRSGVCHLSEDDGVFEAYRSPEGQCLSVDDKRKNILVLGDSHAADFYAVLNQAYGGAYHFLQATAGGCNPDQVYSDAQSRCSELIRYALDVSKGSNLHAVYIAARWKTVDTSKLRRLVKAARKISDRVVIVSPPASFTSEVPRIILKNNGRRSHRDLSSAFFDVSVYKRSAILSDFSMSNDVLYLDRVEMVCGGSGYCPLVSPFGDPYAWDYGHLSPFGIESLAKMLRANWAP